MTLQSSGQIKASEINVELGQTSTTQLSIGSTAARTLAGVSTGQIKYSDFYGKSSSTIANERKFTASWWDFEVDANNISSISNFYSGYEFYGYQAQLDGRLYSTSPTSYQHHNVPNIGNFRYFRYGTITPLVSGNTISDTWLSPTQTHATVPFIATGAFIGWIGLQRYSGNQWSLALHIVSQTGVLSSAANANPTITNTGWSSLDVIVGGTTFNFPRPNNNNTYLNTLNGSFTFGNNRYVYYYLRNTYGTTISGSTSEAEALATKLRATDTNTSSSVNTLTASTGAYTMGTYSFNTAARVNNVQLIFKP